MSDKSYVVLILYTLIGSFLIVFGFMPAAIPLFACSCVIAVDEICKSIKESK